MKNVLGKLIAVFLAAAVAVTPQASAAAEEAPKPQITIMLDGYPLPFTVEPRIVNGTTMVPFRTISEALGISVEWNSAAKTITASDSNSSARKVVSLTINNPVAIVNGERLKLSVAPMITNQSTLIPLSFFSQQFGAAVGWENSTKTVAIVSPRKDIHTLAFYAISSFSEAKYISSFDSVAFGWSRIDKDGNITLQGKDFYWPKPAGEITPETIVADAARQGTSPYLMVYASDSSLELTGILEDEEKRLNTARKISELALEKNFEGIILDFEGLGLTGDRAIVKEQFNSFVQVLSELADSHGIRLSLALHPLNSSYRGYDYRTLGSLADDLVIMAYAYEGENGPEPADKVDEAIKRAIQEVDKSKLILGISMGSENPDSVNVKIGLAKRYGLKGIALWRLGLLGEASYMQIQRSVELES